ncbi:hypothetical protein EI555_001234, partial [Monodon monoceros]
AISISYMETGNQTAISKFILLSLSEDMDLQPLLFGLFLSMYLVCVIGNLLTILAIISDSHHYSPMYFFLSNLSFTDICFSTTTVPKMLVNVQTQNKGITYEGCLTQMYFFMIFAELDNLPLTVMAYDRFVAICHPLYYMVIMNPRLCGLLLLLSWLICLTYSLLQSLVLRVSFCKDAEIPHFFCELAQILKLTCSDALVNDILLYFVTGLLAYKVFSTCGSHLSAISLFYGAGLGVSLTSGTAHPSRKDSVASGMYTVVTPMLNPFIYTPKDLHGALQVDRVQGLQEDKRKMEAL